MRKPNLFWYTIPQLTNIKPETMYFKEKDAAEEQAKLHNFGIENMHVLARAHIIRDDPKAAYTLCISADDYYKLYINGQFVTQGPAPAYPEYYYYNRIDITDYLTEGDNVIAVHLYYLGAINRVYVSADGRFGVAAEVYNESLHKGTGLTWKYHISEAYSGELVGYKVQFLEDFDSRKWDKNWNSPGYDESSWADMPAAVWADYQLLEQPTGSLSIVETEIKPEQIKTLAPNHLLVDLGEEITGSITLRAAGGTGKRIEIRCGEDLNSDGTVNYNWDKKIKYQEFWTLSDGECHLVPYDYKGFRYAELILDEGVELLALKALVRHYPMDETLCTVAASDNRIEKVFEICKRAVKIGTQDGYVDCPTREKGQYLGDSIVISRSQVWLSGKTDVLRKCIEQFAQSSMICNGLMSVAPGSHMQEIADFSLLWSQMLMTDYLFTGDKAFLRKHYPTARGVIEYFKTFEREDHLLQNVTEKWNLVDWPWDFRDGYDFVLNDPMEDSEPLEHGVHNVLNALYLGAVKTVSQIEDILEMDQVDRLTVWDDCYQSFIRVFYDPDVGLFRDKEGSSHCALHSSLYPLYFGFAPDEAKETIADLLIQKGFSCGVLTTYFIMKVLSGTGHKDEVYRLLTSHGKHSWLHMIDQGATTCTEVWERDTKWNFSYCHPWASSPIPLLIEDIAGIVLNPDAPEGFDFNPAVSDSIPDYKLTVPFRGHLITVQKDETGVNYHIT